MRDSDHRSCHAGVTGLVLVYICSAISHAGFRWKMLKDPGEGILRSNIDLRSPSQQAAGAGRAANAVCRASFGGTPPFIRRDPPVA